MGRRLSMDTHLAHVGREGNVDGHQQRAGAAQPPRGEEALVEGMLLRREVFGRCTCPSVAMGQRCVRRDRAPVTRRRWVQLGCEAGDVLPFLSLCADTHETRPARCLIARRSL